MSLKLLHFCVVGALFFQRTWASDSSADKRSKPNIVVILMDDIGWNDLSYNSKDTQISTPNIDRISSQGVRFTQHYVHSVCTPTRASFLTGRYAVNTGLYYVLMPGSPAGLPSHIPTLPQLLKKEGYHTSMVGKW